MDDSNRMDRMHQKANPVISQVTTWIEDGKFSTMNVREDMSQEVKQYLRQKRQLD